MKKLASILLVFVLVLQTTTPLTVFASNITNIEHTNIVVTTEQELRNTISNAGVEPLIITVNDTINISQPISINNGRNIIIDGSGTLTVNGSHRHFIVERTALGDSSLTLRGNITLTRAANFTGMGGGVRVTGNLNPDQQPGDTRLVLRDNAAIVNNEHISHGGGVTLEGASLFLHDNSRIEHNRALSAGGGIDATTGASNRIQMFDNSSISHNVVTAPAANGGGINLGVRDSFVMHGGIINGNLANNGAGINIAHTTNVVNRTQLHLINGQIINNIASLNGGGINMAGAVNLFDSSILVSEETMIFNGNRASRAFNYGLEEGLISFPNIRWFGNNSIPGSHLLNNYDVNFTGRNAPLVTPTEPPTVPPTDPDPCATDPDPCVTIAPTDPTMPPTVPPTDPCATDPDPCATVPPTAPTTDPTMPSSSSTGPSSNAYLVTFDVNGGEGEFLAQSVAYGNFASQPENAPVREGYTFLGWFLDGAETPFNFATTPITGHTTLIAGWAAEAGETTEPGTDAESTAPTTPGTDGGNNLPQTGMSAIASAALAASGTSFIGAGTVLILKSRKK